MICYADNSIKLVTDLNTIDQDEAENNSNITDCFIYAFNPTNEFNPVNLPLEEPYCMIKNTLIDEVIVDTTPTTEKLLPTKKEPKATGFGFKTKQSDIATKKEDSKAIGSKDKITTNNEATKNSSKPKSTGLRSMKLLEKMRKSREEKEQKRQQELKERQVKQRELKEIELNNDPKRKKQLEDLNKLFIDESDDDIDIDKDENSSVDTNVKQQDDEQHKTKTSIINDKKIDDNELDELLDTTMEESMIMSSQPINNKKEQTQRQEQEEEKPEKEKEPQVTTYTDKDGYIVTKVNKSNSHPNLSSTKSSSSIASAKKRLNSPIKKKTTSPVKKRKQGSIESFFKRA